MCTKLKIFFGSSCFCYWEALKRKQDIVVMIHPDYQYDPKLLPDLVKPVRYGLGILWNLFLYIFDRNNKIFKKK